MKKNRERFAKYSVQGIYGLFSSFVILVSMMMRSMMMFSRIQKAISG